MIDYGNEATKLHDIREVKDYKFAEEYGNQVAQREFGIVESNVHLWRKSKEIFRKCRDFNVPIVEGKQLGLDSNKI